MKPATMRLRGPGGSYLGQMHPYHVDFYTAHADALGLDRCEAWATDQKNSAIRGLRELGYTIFGPGEFAQPQPVEPPPPVEPVEPTVSLPPLTRHDPDLLSYREVMSHGHGGGEMYLIRGVHTISYVFAGWQVGPVNVRMIGPDGMSRVVHSGPIAYNGALTVEAPQAGTYSFQVEAERDWTLWTGKLPQAGTVTRTVCVVHPDICWQVVVPR